ncbi:hypothetical protein DV736_g2971, partial [Chaetothyriales sp. CBS 134916]
MAAVRSLGLHEPTALPYLINEGILPPDPPPDAYRWQQYLVPSGRRSELVQEEIVIAGSCVVWSKAGAVRRVLNLDMENEPILHAFSTTFVRNVDTELGDDAAPIPPIPEKAIVVVFQSRAHILLLSGDSHVLPLSFQVGAAFPCPSGFVLQRKIGSEGLADGDMSLSFHRDLSTINESQATIGTSSCPSLILPEAGDIEQNSAKSTTTPRTFSCLQTVSELGLVVQGSTNKLQSLDECKPLSVDEELLYMSRYDELNDNNVDHDDLTLAVTRNTQAQITIWNVARNPPIRIKKPRPSGKLPRKSEASRRKSSNIYPRWETNAAPGPGNLSSLRSSFGGLAQSFAENPPMTGADRKSFAAEDIASQLGPEFGDVGVQTRASRRVSSLLARTDLGAGNDRGTFHELAMGHANRKSLNRPGRRGESIGSFGDRQSFGRRRSSFPATSVLSDGTSFLNIPGQNRFDDLDQNFEDLGLDQPESDLNRDIGFFKLTSFNMPDTYSSDSPDALPKVVTFLGPPMTGSGHDDVRNLSVCIIDEKAKQVAMVNIQVTLTLASKRTATSKPLYRLKTTNIRLLKDISSATLIQDGFVRRLMILYKTRQGQPVVHLEAPWSPPFRVDLPASYVLSASTMVLTPSPSRRHDQGLHGTVPALDIQMLSLRGVDNRGGIVVNATGNQMHSLSLQLAPKDDIVRRVLLMCNLIYGKNYFDNMLVSFWEVFRWLRIRTTDECTEWAALTVLIFTLCVPFTDEHQSKRSTPSKRRRAGLMRSSSGAVTDLSDFNTMKQAHAALLQDLSSEWDWLKQKKRSSSASHPRSPRAHKPSSSMDPSSEGKLSVIQQCIEWAREYIQTPEGESALGPEGYLPVSVSKDRNVRNTAVAKLLVGLHLMHEELKLDLPVASNAARSSSALLPVMAQLGLWLAWHEWTMLEGGAYLLEVAHEQKWLFEESRLQNLEVPAPPFSPPSILGHLAECLVGKPDQPFPTLHLLADAGVDTKTGSSFDRAVKQLTPRTMILTRLLDTPLRNRRPERIKEIMALDLHPDILASFPEALGAAVLQTLMSTKLSCTHIRENEDEQRKVSIATKGSHNMSHTANKDYHSICAGAVEGEPLQRWDASSEADRHAITRLVFNEDRRFQEASKLLNQTRPPVVECTPQPDWSEADLLEAQKELAQFVTRRTLSVASGRGMMHFNSRVPLLTERVPIQAFSLQCIMRPRNATESTQAMTFSADKALFTEEKLCWAFFHNGVSAGHMISKDAKGIDTSWILYNKPPELTNRHAGFLLALGLNGHLKSLARWVAFKYLTPKHPMTSVGLLLGLSVSYLGTQDQQITRLLSVHVTRLLPPGAAELNLSPLTQTTGIIGIGLLYHGSQHRRMTEVMLSEIENDDAEEGVGEESLLRDEGYRLAAGFSLGLINLAQGKQLHALHEMGLTERLLSVAVSTKNVDLVHILDRATAGAVMAIALVFLKTNDTVIARKVDIPDTIHQFDYVRPDIFLLRTLARHLILWDSITPNQDFITLSLPEPYRHRASLSKTNRLSTEDMPFFNILAGICFAIGLKHAGTQLFAARDILISQLDQFLRLVRIPAPNYDSRVTLNSVRNCLDIVALSAAIVMAGSGDLIVMRRLRSLHGRTDRDTPFGSHMAAHMALGALFLGGGTMTFGTSDLAVAALCISLYPMWPNDVLDNKGHLQALRHLWVLAVEGRCLVARDESGTVVGGLEALVKLKNGEEVRVRAPGLLPEISMIESLMMQSESWWDINLSFADAATLERAKREGAVNIPLKRRAAYDKPKEADPLIERFKELEDEWQCGNRSVPSVNANIAAQTHPSTGHSIGGGTDKRNPFGWVFELESFKDFDFAERELVLNPNQEVGKHMLRESIVDYRLMLERGLLPERKPDGTWERVETDKLWNVRIILEWWLRSEVVDRLRDKVWTLGHEINAQSGR